MLLAAWDAMVSLSSRRLPDELRSLEAEERVSGQHDKDLIVLPTDAAPLLSLALSMVP